MKRISVLLCAAVLSVTTFSMFAQDNEQVTTNVSKAKNNWFISLGGGPSILQAEQDQDKPYGERIRFAAELSVGKWFTPYFGARLQLTGGPLRGYNYQENHGGELKERYLREDRSRGEYPLGVTFGKDGQPNWSGIETVGNGFWQDFNYGAATIDLMANLTNLFQGYYKENKVDIIPYLGGGWIHATESNTNPVHDGIVGKLGARVNFNLNPKWAIYLDPQAYFSSDDLDGYVGNRGTDIVANVMVGIQFNINRDYSSPTTILSLDEVNYLNDRINENRGLIENQQGILERQQNLIERLDGRVTNLEKAPIVVQHTDYSTYLPEYIRFTLNSAKIPSSEQNKVNDAIAFLKANPDSKLLLIGYADKKTGNTSHNLNLSRNRVESVVAELKNHGINSNRIIQEWKGDKEQPFAQNDWNRVVILVERK